MNKPHLLHAATLTIALLGAGAALASEATQFEIGPGAASRADVSAELQRALAAGELSRPSAQHGEFGFLASGSRSRDEVRREAMREARIGNVAARFIGS